MEPPPKSLESLFIQRVALDSIHPDLALAELLAKYPEQADQLHSLHSSYATGTQTMDSAQAPPPEEFIAAGVARQYEDRGQLGVGGGGEVRLVWDPRLRRELAMKLLPKGMTLDGSAISLARGQRFLNEARLTGSLEHPGVIPVHDMGVDDRDQPFFTMQRVSGRTFTDLIDELYGKSPASDEPWSLQRIIGALQRVCETMAFAHSKGVLHRDLKPANLMVGSYGEVYVMDWGLAHTPDASSTDAACDTDVFAPTGDDVGLTMDGEVLGTPSFMAPEQADGVLGDLDQRADVYSIGAVLYHVLAGHAPYREPGSSSDAYELLKCLRKGKPMDPGLAPTDVPEPLLAICRKAMSRDRKQRYPSTKSLGKDLRAWSEGRVVGAHRTGIGIEIVKWAQRNRALAGSLALACVIAITGIGAFVIQRTRANHELAKSNYVGTIAQISQALENGWTGHVIELMNSVDPMHRGWEYWYLDARLHGDNVVSAEGVHGVGDIVRVDISDDGRYLLSGDSKGEIALWDAAQPEGQSAATLLHVWRSEIILGRQKGITDLHLFGDGTAFVVNFSGESQLHVYDCTTKELRFKAPASRQNWDKVSLSSDSQLISTIDDQGEFRLLRSNDGAPVLGGILKTAPSITSTLCVLGSGPGIAYTDSELRVFTSAGPLRSLQGASSDRIRLIASDHDGERVAILNDRGTVWLWDLDANDPAFQLGAFDGGTRSIAFSPEGDRLALTQGARIDVWGIDTNLRLSTFEGHRSKVQSVAWSQDGSLLASGAMAGELRIWDPKGKQNQTTPLPSELPPFGADTTATRLLLRTERQFGAFDLNTGVFEPFSPLGGELPSASAWDPDTEARFDYYFETQTLTRVAPGEPMIQVDLTQLNPKYAGSFAMNLLLPVPDQNRLLFCNRVAGPCILDKTTLEFLRPLAIPRTWGSVHLTEGNRTLALSSLGVRYLVDLESGQPIAESEKRTGEMKAWISPDGSRWAILCNGKRQLRFVDRASGEELFRTIETDSDVRDGLWSKAGDRVLTIDADGYLSVWDAESGKLALRITGIAASGQTLHMSQDGSRVVLGAQGQAKVFVSLERENQAE